MNFISLFNLNIIIRFYFLFSEGRLKNITKTDMNYKSELPTLATKFKNPFSSVLHKDVTLQLSILLIFFIAGVIRVPVESQHTASGQNPYTNLSYSELNVEYMPLHNASREGNTNKNASYYQSTMPELTKTYKTFLEHKTITHTNKTSNTSYTSLDKQKTDQKNFIDVGPSNEFNLTKYSNTLEFLDSEIPAKINLSINSHLSEILNSVLSKNFEAQYAVSNSHKTRLLQSYGVARVYRFSENESIYDNLNISDDISLINFTLQSTTEISSSDLSVTLSKIKQLYFHFQSNDYLNKLNPLITNRLSYNFLLEMINSTSTTEFAQGTQLKNSSKKSIPHLDSNSSPTSESADTPIALPLTSYERNASELLVSTFHPNKKNTKTITILGLFEMTTNGAERPEGRSELAAARLAITHVNQKNILSGYQLQLVVNDTKVRIMFCS